MEADHLGSILRRERTRLGVSTGGGGGAASGSFGGVEAGGGISDSRNLPDRTNGPRSVFCVADFLRSARFDGGSFESGMNHLGEKDDDFVTLPHES